MENERKINLNLLDVKLENTDIGDVTLREYLVKLLETLWNEEEGFSGKRPFGNSCWAYEIYTGFAKAGIIDCKIDEDGYVDYMSSNERAKADSLVFDAIRSLNGVVEV